MRKISTPLFLFTSLVFCQCKEASTTEKKPEAEKTAQIKFNNIETELGDIKGTRTNYDFIFHNTGDAPLIISSAGSSCHCVKAVWPQRAVLPGDSAAINVSLDLSDVAARFIRTLTVQSNAKEPIVVLQLSGEVKK